MSKPKNCAYDLGRYLRMRSDERHSDPTVSLERPDAAVTAAAILRKIDRFRDSVEADLRKLVGC